MVWISGPPPQKKALTQVKFYDLDKIILVFPERTNQTSSIFGFDQTYKNKHNFKPRHLKLFYSSSFEPRA